MRRALSLGLSLPRLRLVTREDKSLLWQGLAPLLAYATTGACAYVLLAALGANAASGLYFLLAAPVLEPSHWQDVGLKAAPLMMIALGLVPCFRANIWNIGAEGQYVVAAIAGTGVALTVSDYDNPLFLPFVLPLVLLCGALGGCLYALIPGLLRIALGVNEILVSLMLNYCAINFLAYLVNGPWKDPQGFNFPQTRLIGANATLGPLYEGTLLHGGFVFAVALCLLFAVLLKHTVFGYAIDIFGLAPKAARYAGFRPRVLILLCLGLSGALSGLAGMVEVCANFQQLTPQFPTGYGYSAIIVAFLGRLSPLGVIAGALILAITYVGGELAQTFCGLPHAASAVCQALLLFFLLAFDILVRWRVEVLAVKPPVAA